MKIVPYFFILPLLLQAFGMLVDEFYFHHHRRMPSWEKWSHPLDTFLVLLCFLLVLLAPITEATLLTYFLLSVASMLLVTKDEWVHKRECSAGEHWLHSMLFLLHPLMLISAAMTWPFVRVEQMTILLSKHFSDFTAGAILGLVDLGVGHFQPTVAYLKIHTLMAILFLIYQIVYWTWLDRPKKAG